MKSIAVIGCGHLATAVTTGIMDYDFHTYTPSFTRAEKLAKDKSGKVYKELSQMPACDFIFLGMKPQQFPDFVEVSSSLSRSKNSVFISLLASTNAEKIKHDLKTERVIRSMSNTPSLINAGLHALFYDPAIEQETKDIVKGFFKSSGEVLEFTEEDKLDAITPFSGSGPAYLFDLARILTQELVERGFSEQAASRCIKQTLLGAGQLYSQSELSALELREQVTSKAGITEEVLKSLWRSDFDNNWKKALKSGDRLLQELKDKNI